MRFGNRKHRTESETKITVAMMGWGAQEQQGWRKGPWTPEEDKLLSEYVNLHGEGRWSAVARGSGLNRSGKSCRLRWVNYLRPGLKRGQITPQEEGIIIELHSLWGNKWSTIARYLPGRTDNEIKNYWRTHFKKKEKPCQKREKRKGQKQQQQLLEDEIIKRVSPSGDEQNLKEEQEKQETFFTCSTTANLEDHCLPAMSLAPCSWADSLVDDGLWGGLWSWNLDDSHSQLDHSSNCNKIAMQNQATPICFGGDSNIYGGGYIY